MKRHRELQRLERLNQTRNELIKLLDGGQPNYVQKSILKNLDESITEKKNLLKQNYPVKV